MDGGATGYTSSEFAGTLRYLAPELLEERSVRTLETDVYALGCTCMQVGRFTICATQFDDSSHFRRS